MHCAAQQDGIIRTGGLMSPKSLTIPTALSEPETHLPAVGGDAERSGYSGSGSCPKSASIAQRGGSGAKPCFRSSYHGKVSVTPSHRDPAMAVKGIEGAATPAACRGPIH